MKKILILILMIFTSFSLCSFTSRVDVQNGTINRTSLVDVDLVNLDLTPTDYIKLNFTEDMEVYADYDSWYLIAMAENRIGMSETDLFFYIYNPVRQNEDYDFYFDLKVNDREYSVFLTSNSEASSSADLKALECGESYISKNVTKYVVNYKNDFNTRSYKVDSINCSTLNYNSNNPFEATFNEKENADGVIETTFLYSSFVHITEDELVYFEFSKFANAWEELKALFTGDLFDEENGITSGVMVFYNFSSSRKIENILEFEYDIDLYHKVVKDYDNMITDEVYNIYYQQGRQLKLPEKTKQMIYNQEIEISAFMTPASNRLEEFKDIDLKENVINSFKSFEHSVLIDIQRGDSSRRLGSSGSAIGAWTETYTFHAENMQVKRIKFEANGKVYNAYVSDDKDDGVDGGELGDPKKEWWQILLEWIIANPIKAVILGLIIIVGMPLIVSLLPGLMGVCFKLLFWLIKFAIGIIKIPFKLLGWIFGIGKEKK